MAGRGLSPYTIERFRLGLVPIGHPKYGGMIAIPYLNDSGVATMRFRHLRPDIEPKYIGLRGHETRLFNVAAFDRNGPVIYICEGEIDTMIAEQEGLNAAGVPGAKNWKPWMARRFRGTFRRVIILSDGDDKGESSDMAAKIMSQVSVAEECPMRKGYDVASFVAMYGEGTLKEYVSEYSTGASRHLTDD